jgi:hypothetical protein
MVLGSLAMLPGLSLVQPGTLHMEAGSPDRTGDQKLRGSPMVVSR